MKQTKIIMYPSKTTAKTTAFLLLKKFVLLCEEDKGLYLHYTWIIPLLNSLSFIEINQKKMEQYKDKKKKEPFSPTLLNILFITSIMHFFSLYLFFS